MQDFWKQEMHASTDSALAILFKHCPLKHQSFSGHVEKAAVKQQYVGDTLLETNSVFTEKIHGWVRFTALFGGKRALFSEANLLFVSVAW